MKLAQTNPQFAEFVRKNQNKSVSEIAEAYGIDTNAINMILKML